MVILNVNELCLGIVFEKMCLRCFRTRQMVSRPSGNIALMPKLIDARTNSTYTQKGMQAS